MQIFDGFSFLATHALPFSALGGFLSGIRQNRCIQKPVLVAPQQISLGFVGDILFGVAGGIAIFLILPFTPDANAATSDPGTLTDEITAMKLFGIAFLGGWGGPTLLDFIMQKTFLQEAMKKADEAKESATKASEKIEKTEERIHDVREQLKKDNKALSLMVKHLSGPPDPPVPDQELYPAIAETSFDARERIFREAKRTRLSEEMELERWRKEVKVAAAPSDKTLANINLDKHCQFMSRISTIFRALAEGFKDDEINHLYHANLGYALMALGKYEDAMKSLGTAIQIRDEKKAGDYPYYEFTRARICICLSKPTVDDALKRKILQDLRRAGGHDETREAIRRDALVQGWLLANGLSESAWLGG